MDVICHIHFDIDPEHMFHNLCNCPRPLHKCNHDLDNFDKNPQNSFPLYVHMHSDIVLPDSLVPGNRMCMPLNLCLLYMYLRRKVCIHQHWFLYNQCDNILRHSLHRPHKIRKKWPVIQFCIGHWDMTDMNCTYPD